MTAPAFDVDAGTDQRRSVIRRTGDEVEMVDLAWGLKPTQSGGFSCRFIRSEGRLFPSHRCLIPASEFHVRRGGRRYRFVLSDGNWFYLAGIWRPVSEDWPEAFAIVSVAANEEVSRYQDRQGAVLRRPQRQDWLDMMVPESRLLIPLPARSFRVEQMFGDEVAQPLLAF